jgi:hypothetical protein
VGPLPPMGDQRDAGAAGDEPPEEAIGGAVAPFIPRWVFFIARWSSSSPASSSPSRRPVLQLLDVVVPALPPMSR